MRAVQCLDEAVVLAFVAGELEPGARASSEAHLDVCSACLSLLAEVTRASAPDAASESAPGSDGRDGAGSAARPPSRLARDSAARYELGDVIARGGMGTVYAAHDRVLGRDVAIKLMGRDDARAAPAPGELDRLPTVSAEVTRRFAREVALTARLQHPSIVPVYDSGALADGTPFYAMRMVAGQTLETAAASAGSLDQRLTLVPAILAVAEAIAYAHSRGVVHRDLKPHNVLVGPFGETVVLDWGLAKEVRAVAESAASRSGSGERPDHPADRIGETTATGALVGTLAYMAPERFNGEAGDERGDVYGLGAILYRVLAGRVPRGQVGQEPEPIAHLQRGLPAELSAIVDRAMAEEPAGRYASAAELVDDLRRFLTGQMVAAHRYSRRELVRRWIARHRAAVAAAALAVAGIALVTALSFQRVVAQREAADSARARAEQERRAAEELVGFLIGDLRVRLEALGRLDVLGGAARSIDAYFARVPVREGSDGFADLTRRGQALSIVGDAALAAGNLQEAQVRYDGALASLRAAAARRPGSSADDALCRTALRQADLARARGDLARARDEASRCTRMAAAYVERGGHLDWQYHLAASLADEGRTAWMRGDNREARRILEQAEAATDRLARSVAAGARLSEPDRVEELRALVPGELAQIGLVEGDLDLARRAAVTSRDVLERQAAARPDDAEALQRLGVARMTLGGVHRAAGDIELAVRELQAARATLEPLVAGDPANAAWKRALGNALQQIAEAELARGRPAVALPLQERSRDITRELLALNPASREARRDIVVDEFTVAEIERALGWLDRAARTVRRASKVAAELATGPGADARAEIDLAEVLVTEARIHLERRRAGEAAPVLARAIALRRGLLAASDTPEARQLLASALLVQLELPVRLRVAKAEPCAVLAEVRAILAPAAEMAASHPDLASVMADLDRASASHPRCKRG
jgi:tetratricopeptide (TPR) repeat protein